MVRDGARHKPIEVVRPTGLVRASGPKEIRQTDPNDILKIQQKRLRVAWETSDEESVWALEQEVFNRVDHVDRLEDVVSPLEQAHGWFHEDPEGEHPVRAVLHLA